MRDSEEGGSGERAHLPSASELDEVLDARSPETIAWVEAARERLKHAPNHARSSDNISDEGEELWGHSDDQRLDGTFGE